MPLSYITREDAIFALSKMKSFHDECKGLFERHGFNLLENLGRRNILLSNAQEKYFAEALARRFNVTSDGRPGEPDILIKSLDRELECKLTSRHRSGAISFQTDYETLEKKGSLDYLYVVASENFDSFAVVHYVDLKPSDFRGLSSGSRGKSQLKKYSAHDRANVLLGKMVNLSKNNLERLHRGLGVPGLTARARKKINKSIDFWENNGDRYSIELEKI